MKTRNGFVSNSSTSSFVIVGVLVTKEEVEKLEEELGDDFYNHYEYLEDQDCYIGMGKALADCDECGMSDAEYTFEELQKIFQDTAKKHNCDISKVKLFMGTTSC